MAEYNPYVETACLEIKKKVKEICTFCEALINIVNSKLDNDPMRVICINTASIFLMSYNEKKLADKVVEKTHPYWKQIIDKDETFFIEKADNIFGEIPTKTDLFSDLFSKNVLSSKQKDKLWSLFEELIPVCCTYIHEMRVPVKKEINNKFVGTYDVNYRNNIKIKEYVQKYKIPLRF